jgi:hypothetical protein
MKTTTKTIDITGSTDRHCYGPDGVCRQMAFKAQRFCPEFGCLENELGPDGWVPVRHEDCLIGEARC